MGLIKKGLTNEEIIELVQLHAPTIEGLTQARVLQLITENGTKLITENGTKLMTGSYKGTNNYGNTKPNILTFERRPKIVFITNGEKTGFALWMCNSDNMLVYNGSGNYWLSSYNTSVASYSDSDNTLSWYDTKSVYYQLNGPNQTYEYLAIG